MAPIFRVLLPAALAGALLLPAAARAATPSFVKNGSVTLCSDPSYAPMEFFRKTGEKTPVGFDIDIAHDLAKAWGAKLRIVTMDFTGLLPGLAAHRCDFIISGIFVTPARTKTFDAVPYLRSSMVILTRAGAAIHSPADLAGKVVGVQSGTQYEVRAKALSAALRKQGKKPLKIQSYPKETDVIEQLSTGRAAAVLTQDTEAAWRQTAQKGMFQVGYVYPPTDSFGIYFRKSVTDKAIITGQVKALRGQGLVKELAAKWKMPESDATAALK